MSPMRSSALGPSGRLLLGNAIVPPPVLLLGLAERRFRSTAGARDPAPDSRRLLQRRVDPAVLPRDPGRWLWPGAEAGTT
jgi:hypothetical protein